MYKTILILPGDGIGTETVKEAVKVLNKVAAKFNHKFSYMFFDINKSSLDKCQCPISENALHCCKTADAILTGTEINDTPAYPIFEKELIIKDRRLFPASFPQLPNTGTHMTPSVYLTVHGADIYAPAHGDAPDIAYMNIANPIGTILSASLMIRYSFGMEAEAEAIETAISAVFDKNLRTMDIMDIDCKQINCSQMGDMISSKL